MISGASVILVAASGVPLDFFMADGLTRWKDMSGGTETDFFGPGWT